MNVTPVPIDQLSPELQHLYAGAAKEGMRRMITATAHAPEHAALYWTFYNQMRFANSLGSRLNEIVRVVAAATTECQVCFGSDRVESSGTAELSKDDIRAMVDVGGDYSPRELAAIRFTYKLGTDHLSICSADFEELHAHFSEREIMEIGLLASQFIGMGRLSAVLALEDPVCTLDVGRRGGEPAVAVR